MYRSGPLSDPRGTGVFLSTNRATADSYSANHAGAETKEYTLHPDAKIYDAVNRWQAARTLDPKWDKEKLTNRYIAQQFKEGKLVNGLTAEQRVQAEAERRIKGALERQGYHGVRYSGGVTDQNGEYQIFDSKHLSEGSRKVGKSELVGFVGKTLRIRVDDRAIRLAKYESVSKYTRKQLQARSEMENVLASFLQKTGNQIAAKIRGFAKVTKADDEETFDPQALLDIVLPIDWAPLLQKLGPYMDEIAVQAAVKALRGVGVSDANIISFVNQAASDWASDRAAEMVGMRRLANGDLIENPDARWAISETTRDDIRELVTNAFLEKSSLRDLAKQVQEAGTFAPSRAKMIARTESKRAQTQGNITGWRESKVVGQVELQLSNDHDHDDECDEAADGGPYELDDAPDVPLHPNCECVLVPILSDDE